MAERNSLVENINRRKQEGISRPKSRSTVSKQAYSDMQKGWPGKGRKSAAKSSSKRKRGTRRRKASGRKSSTRK